MLRAKFLIPLRTAAFAALLSAGTALAADNQEAVVSDGLPSMPAFGAMPEMADADLVPNQNPTRYQAGVRAYLNGKDDEAIANLEEAVRTDAADERASRLLIKVYIRSINGSYQSGNRQKARSLVQKARDRFPENPEVKLLYSSVQENRSAAGQDEPAGSSGIAAVRKSQFSRKTAEAPARAAVHGRELTTQHPPPVIMPALDRVPPAASPAPAVSLMTLLQAGRINVSYAGAAAALFLGTIVFIVFIYRQFSRQDALLQRVEELQKAMAERETASASVRRELDIWKGFGKQVEELDLLRKTKEKVIHLELEQMRVEEERKIMSHLAEKRREAERLVLLEMAAMSAPKAAPQAPAPEKASSAPPAPPKAPPQQVRGNVASREDRILEILADIAPPEREAAWERIAVQSAELYAEAPEEAVKFFRAIAADKEPLNRASIAGALAGIAVPETLDILLELYLDPGVEVRREALKRLNILNKDQSACVDAAYREKIVACLSEEKEKGEWVF